MQTKDAALSARLQNLWKGPDFNAFFQKYCKRQPIKIKKGSTIFYEGDIPDKIYFLKNGYVKMYRTSESGREPIIYLYGPGSLLGVRALTSKDETLKHSAEALTDVELVLMTRTEYLQILSENPEYIIDLLHVFISRLNYTERKLEGFILTDTVARVANFLVDCAKHFGDKKGKNFILPFQLTHQKIADFVGAFRETVTIAIDKLEDEKIITVTKGVITILDLKRLEEKTLHDSLED